MSKLQIWHLKGLLICAYTNLTTMRCSGSSRFGVVFRDKIFTYGFCCWCKILMLHPLNSYSTQLKCIPSEILIEKKFSFIVRLLYFVGIRSVLKLKGQRHDWGQCLFTKTIWHEILIEFLQKVIQKCTKHFGKDWAINRAEITHKSLYL